MNFDETGIRWLGHSCFKIRTSDNRIIYFDPYSINEDSEKADLILISHSHHDHCSVEDINKVIKENTRIVITADCQSKITRLKVPVRIEIMEPGSELNFGNLRIFAVPAYNVDKSFHPKEESWVGYLVKINSVMIYHAGDTDVIPEMRKLTGHKKEGKKFVALLPVGGRFTMNSEEAVEAAKILKPDLAIPMHYGAIVGTKEDGREFVKLCEEEGINAKVLEIKI